MDPLIYVKMLELVTSVLVNVSVLGIGVESFAILIHLLVLMELLTAVLMGLVTLSNKSVLALLIGRVTFVMKKLPLV
jgi:hypothetical protein